MTTLEERCPSERVVSVKKSKQSENFLKKYRLALLDPTQPTVSSLETRYKYEEEGASEYGEIHELHVTCTQGDLKWR